MTVQNASLFGRRFLFKLTEVDRGLNLQPSRTVAYVFIRATNKRGKVKSRENMREITSAHCPARIWRTQMRPTSVFTRGGELALKTPPQ